jgi:ubiquinone/menaquinone biosynthesis C-methylase UbiE
MAIDDRFDDLIETLAGFHRTWIVHLGLELGLLARIRDAGPEGIAPDVLAVDCGCAADPVRAWTIAADAHGIVLFDGDRLTVDEATARVLLDEDSPDYLGGQLSHAVVASLDHGDMAEVFRSGRSVVDRPDRYRTSIERLTRQDIAVFFEEALATLPELVATLAAGAHVLDLHCGGARWLIAVARRFPETTLMGVEFEPDSVERARRSVAAAGLSDRIEIVQAALADIDRSEATFDLAYFQYALYALRDPIGALRAGWRGLRPGGRLIVFEWTAPTELDEYRTAQGRLISAIQLDELFQGSRLRTVDEFAAMFAEAGLPPPEVIELPSGATLLLVTRRDDPSQDVASS